jgi:hypothetical protein
MRKKRALAVALTAVAAVVAGRDTPADTGPTCAGPPWRLSIGPPWSEATGQNTMTFVLRNSGSTSCALRGYPVVVLLDGDRHVLPFTYSHRGDQMITNRRPRRVLVASGRAAFFALNKYRCDARTLAVGRFVRVALPHSQTRLELRLPRSNPTFRFCGRGAPSGIIAVSPIVARLSAAAAHH